MKDHGSKLSRGNAQTIAALIGQPSRTDDARGDRKAARKITLILMSRAKSILAKAHREPAMANSRMGSNKPRPGTIKRQKAFLRAFAENFSIEISARLAGINRTTHYDWLVRDAKYRAKFEVILPRAAAQVTDYLRRRALSGVFEPVVYKGQYCYADRERTLCTLADGTSAFEDEVPKDAEVTARRTVTTRDGKMIGRTRIDTRALEVLAAELMPERWGNARQRKRTMKARLSRCSVEVLFASEEPVVFKSEKTDLQSADFQQQ